MFAPYGTYGASEKDGEIQQGILNKRVHFTTDLVYIGTVYNNSLIRRRHQVIVASEKHDANSVFKKLEEEYESWHLIIYIVQSI